MNRLQRWSQRKADARRGGMSAPAARPDVMGASEPASRAAVRVDTPTAADIVGLDASSDYARFLHADVAGDVRVEALRKLWSSDPGLTVTDGLIDYGGDFTIQPLSSELLLSTAFRIGMGSLTDEEAAAWAALGREDNVAPESRGASPDAKSRR